MTFEEVLYEKLNDMPRWNLGHRRLERILSDSHNPKGRARAIAVMESHARQKMGVGPNDAVDWSNAAVPWATLIQLLVQLLPLLLALFGGGGA